MSVRALISVVTAALLVSACASPVERQLAESARTLAPAAAGGERSFEQLITFSHEEHSQQFIAAGEICDGAMTLALLSPEGLEVLRLRHDAEGVHTRVRRELPEWLESETILADMQFVLWPAEALEQAWGPSWSLREDARGRTLLRDDQSWARADFNGDPWQGGARLEHLRFGYRLEIRTLHHEITDTDTEQPCR